MQDLRNDLQLIADLIPQNSKILEIGCGEGELLKYLDDNKNTDSRGIDIEQPNVSQAVKLGLAVIQGDVDIDLKMYPDKCFDYVISSQVLQATKNPKQVLKEILRISKNCIISIPNFGHWKNRYYLGFKGKMPVTKNLTYQWYETPNIHFCTINDFNDLCSKVNAQTKDVIYLGKEQKPLNLINKLVSHNLFAEKAIFVLLS